MNEEKMDRILAQLQQPTKEKPPKTYASSYSSTPVDSLSDSSDSDNIYFCRLCNKNIKGGKKEIKPEDEVCKTCVINFPERMFCKKCKRYFTNKKAFGKDKTRCNFCHDKLAKIREARKKREEALDEPAPKKSRKQDDEENYVCLYLKGQCVFKKHFTA